MSDISEFFQNITLPSIPNVAHSLLQTLNNDDASIADISRLISRDPAIAAKLLRLANSAQFGLSKNVSSLSDAMALVGINKIRTLALGSCLTGVFPVMNGLNANTFWKTSMACAGYAEWLAREAGTDTQSSWLAGMMLRLGEILIGQAQPTALTEIEQLPILPGERWQREIELVGYSEGEITAELARRWNFPENIVTALKLCANPVGEKEHFPRMAGVIHMAGILADIPFAQPDDVMKLPVRIRSELFLKTDSLAKKFPRNADFIDVRLISN